MRPSISSVSAKLVGKFLGNSTDYESLPLSPEPSTNVSQLSVLEDIMGVPVGTYIGSVWFGFILPILMTAGVEVSGAAVSVSVWDARAALAKRATLPRR